ncbi:phosphate transport system regulatory protein PhoU [candidate division Kazan bacterium]|uniref:Phosphate-specific transport system accessory protein PhoU n=1 Tax=candidate division Kazan bacterium TaxID=2202143 RepID=A0A420ZC19_UNCK3|nr:MAG: phosphate transport system regulatory protein PhoU [candidate division Kazan bacterium]
MEVHLHREIDRLKRRILSLGAEVENALGKSVKALKKWDIELARSVVKYDSEIDRIEVEIEEECLKILALHQPVAIDLRFTITVLKINNDLERVADLAANMAERVLYLSGRQNIQIPEKLTMIVSMAQSMLKRSLDALVNLNTDLAREVINDDDIIDELHTQMYDYVQEKIKKEPSMVDCQINLLSVSRYLERISDLVTNIAEDVIYMVEGEIVRHRM